MDALRYISTCLSPAPSTRQRAVHGRAAVMILVLFVAITTAASAQADPASPTAAPNQPVELPAQGSANDTGLNNSAIDELPASAFNGAVEPGRAGPSVDSVYPAAMADSMETSADYGGPTEHPIIVESSTAALGENAPPRPASRTVPLRRANRTSGSGTPQGDGESGPPVWYRTQIGALAVVLAAIAVCFWALRRWAPTLRVRSAGAIRVVARTPLGPRQTIAVVQLGRRFLILGVSPGRVDNLGNVDDPREAGELAALLGADWAGTSSRFTTALEGEAADFREADDDPAAAVVSGTRLSKRLLPSGPMAELLERLKRLQRSA